MVKDKLISVVMPVYNGEDFIVDSVRSVINQTYHNLELIVVDDCSSDNSVNIIRSFVEKDSRVCLVQANGNSGAAVARNIAIKASKGRYIAFLDADDLWMPEKLEKQIAFMQENNCPFSFSAYEKINELGDVIGKVGVPSRVTYHALLKTCVIGCLTAMYDTSHFGKVDMPLIRKRQDFGLWLKLLKEVDFACGIKEPLAQYRVHDNSISANKINAATWTWRLYRDIEKLNFLKASYYFSHYAFRGLLRSKAPRLSKLIGIMS